MTEVTIQNLFPIPVYLSDGYKLNSKNKNILIKEVIKNQEPNQNGNIYSANTNILDIECLSDLKKYLIEQINNYIHEVLSINKSIEVYITQSWLNINRTDTSHHVHHHPNSFISGTYYLQGNTPISFTHERNLFQNFSFNFNQSNFYNTDACDVTVQEGRCLIFPSTLTHYVKPNANKEERISLSFNTFFRGEPSTSPSKKLQHLKI